MKFNYIKRNLSIIIFFFFTSFFYSNNYETKEIFNDNLSPATLDSLYKNKVFVNNAKSISKLSIKNFNEQTNRLFNTLNKLNPNYLAEIIKIIPIEQNKNLIFELKTILTDIHSYKGIPYYSEHNDIWVDLYKEAKIISKNNYKSKDQIKAYFWMEPFKEIYSTINIDYYSNSIFYENINTSDIKYKDFTCIKSSNMKSFIIVLKTKTHWIMYGIGAVKAPKIPIVTKRIELSFMNRIKTFCNFIFDKMKLVK